MNSGKIFLRTVLLVLVVVAGLPLSARSGQLRPIQINGDDSAVPVAYRLYKNGALVCTVTAPLWPLSCNVFIDDVPMLFTVAAVDGSGQEGPLSDPYTLVPPAASASGNYLPLAVIKSNLTAGTAPLTVGFDGSGSSDLDGLIKSFAWSFGDGSVGSGQFVDHNYSTPGNYTATLTVTDDGGATAASTVAIAVAVPPVVVNQPPLASFTAALLVAGTTQLGFDASASRDPDGTIVSYGWNFGDGATATGRSVNHQFLAAGDFTVTLTVVDNQGASAQDRLLVSVVDPTPGPAPSTPVAVITASLNKQLLHFSWQYDSALTPGLAGFRLYQNHNLACQIANPAARQADCALAVDAGQVVLGLTAYDSSGVESASASEFLFNSSGIFPQASGGQAPLTVHFSSGASTAANGTIVNASWNFGDGTVASGAVLDHVFPVSGSYLVTLTVTDSLGGTGKSTATIAVSKRPPVAGNSSFTGHANQLLTGTLSGSDPEKSALLFTLTGNGTLGTATITNAATGAFSYQPKAGSLGTDSFTFKVNNGSYDSNVATVTVQLTNNPPAAQPLAFTVAEDGAGGGILPASDPDNDRLTYALVANGKLGSAVLTDPVSGAFTYTPRPLVYGSDSFTFKVNDGLADSNLATVTVTITQVNHPPVANPDTATTKSGVAVAVELLANDTDLDGDTLLLATVGQGGHGQVQIVGNKASYTPAAAFFGSDTFSYTVTDGKGGTASGTATVTVTQPQLLVGATWSYDGKQTVAKFRLYANGVLAGETATGTARQFQGLVPQPTGPVTFTLTAVDSAGGESSLSNALRY